MNCIENLNPNISKSRFPKVLVLGKTGQLAQSIAYLIEFFPTYHFIFWGKEAFNFLNRKDTENILKLKPNFILNTVAYTQVDKAETELETAHYINGFMVGEIAKIAEAIHAKFIHISSDYVYDGQKKLPYFETDETHPLNVYGKTKLEGDLLAMKYNPTTTIIRTSWVYAPFGKNFFLTMKTLLAIKKEINVVDDQFGCPTFAFDLAKCMLQIMVDSKNQNKHFGVFHYQNNGGPISWYQFATQIKDLYQLSCKIKPIPSKDYMTPCTRPEYSYLCTDAIKKSFPNVSIRHWELALQDCKSHINN